MYLNHLVSPFFILFVVQAPSAAPEHLVSLAKITELKEQLAEEKVKTAETAKSAAEKEKAAAEDAKEVAEERYRDLSTGKFIESGVTGGIALTFQTDLSWSRDNVKQRTSMPSATPYLLLLPAYWAAKPEINKYCAASWSRDVVAAQDAADKHSLRRAMKSFDTLIDAVRLGKTITEVSKALKMPEGTEISTYLFELAHSLINTKVQPVPPVTPVPLATREAIKAMLVRQIAIEVVDWTPGAPPKARYCLRRKLLGIWVGVPVSKFDARIESHAFEDDGVAATNTKRTVQPRVSFGWGIAPNATVTVLLGLTYSTVEVPNAATAMTTASVGIWSFTAGIGGNLDIINLFRKK